MLVREHARNSDVRAKLSGRRILVLSVSILAAACALIAFLPAAFGGRASYVVTDGVSMLPRFKADGLVIARAESSYHVGEVVAYHNHQLHRVVMHRIVAMDGDRYVFKGDNNPFADQYHATKTDLVGQEWLYWPGGGKYLNILRNPTTFAVIIGLITLLAFRPARRSRRRRRHHA